MVVVPACPFPPDQRRSRIPGPILRCKVVLTSRAAIATFHRMLDPSSPLPLYHQLAERLARAIDDGSYAPGAKLPSENRLALEFGLGRPTVRQATEVLVRQGLVMRRRGAGTFVCAARPRVDLFSLIGTRSALAADAGGVDVQLLAPAALIAVPFMSGINPFAGAAAIFISRISRLHGTPVLLESIFLCPDMFSDILNAELEGKSLSRWVEDRLGLRPLSADQQFSVVPVRGRAAKVMAVSSGTKLLFVERRIHFRGSEDGVFVELTCRTDRMNFTQTIQGVEHG